MGNVRYYDNAGNGEPRARATITPSYVQLWTPTTDQPTVFTLLEPWLWPFHCHYWERRTRPCVARYGPCAACQALQSTRLTAWIAAVQVNTRQRVLLQLTAGAIAGCPELLAADGKLQWKQVLVQRRHRGKQSPVDVQLAAGRNHAIPPVSVDTVKVLGAVWGMAEELVESLIAEELTTPLDRRTLAGDNSPQ